MQVSPVEAVAGGREYIARTNKGGIYGSRWYGAAGTARRFPAMQEAAINYLATILLIAAWRLPILRQ
jgi:hypothetical protein